MRETGSAQKHLVAMIMLVLIRSHFGPSSSVHWLGSASTLPTGAVWRLLQVAVATAVPMEVMEMIDNQVEAVQVLVILNQVLNLLKRKKLMNLLKRKNLP